MSAILPRQDKKIFTANNYHRFVACIGVIITMSLGNVSAAQSSPIPPTLFGLKNVRHVEIQMDGVEWDKIQPSPDAKTDFVSLMMAFEDVTKDAAKGKHFRSPKSTRPGLAGYLGIDHQYGRADVTIASHTVDNVGLRFKGNGTFIEGTAAGKLSLKIDFNEYDDELEFYGLTKINLNNNVTDPSYIREALSYELFREVGIPCSRVGFAQVRLSVKERFDKDLGLFTIVEQVDKRFLKDRFGSSKGLLLKPSTFGIFRYFGEEWAEYEIGYVPKTEPTPEQQRRVIEFAKLLNDGEDEEFAERVEEYLDVEQFLKFVAVNVLLCNLDSFLGGAQNYYVHLDSATNQFQFLPWDMDHSFGAFPLIGTPQSRCELSIDHPGGESHRLIERVLSIDSYHETYHAYLDEYLVTVFAQDKLTEQIETIAGFVRPLLKDNGKALERFDRVLAATPHREEPHPLKYYVSQRVQSVRRQLDGESTGQALHDQQPKSFPVRRFIGFACAMIVLLILHFAGWIWGGIAGFRHNVKWGLLNLFLYPVTPTVYGVAIRKELGGRAAAFTLFCVAALIIWIIAAVAAF